jgi:hypothetical protein
LPSEQQQQPSGTQRPDDFLDLDTACQADDALVQRVVSQFQRDEPSAWEAINLMDEHVLDVIRRRQLAGTLTDAALADAVLWGKA